MMRWLLALIHLLFAATAWAAPPIELKTVPLDAFMHGLLKAPIDLPVPVPAAYDWAPLAKAPPLHAYWMRPEDVASVGQSGSLPAAAGYMYGNLSLNVGYDTAQDVFTGADDPASLQKLRSAFPSARTERLRYGTLPVLLVTLEAPDSGRLVYAMYVGLGVDANVVYVALRPPGNSKDVGDQVWAALRAAILKAGPPPDAPPARR